MKDKLYAALAEFPGQLCVLSTSGDDGQPESAVTVYTVFQDSILVSTDTSTRKWKNLERNPKIAVVVGWSFDRPHVQLEGTVDLVKPGDDEHAALDRTFFKAHPESMGFRSETTGFVRITPTWARVTEFAPGGPPQVEESKL